MNCSVSSGGPKARKPRVWLTLCTSQPSESMLTLTMHRTCSPARPLLPTVLIISRSTDSLPFSASKTLESTGRGPPGELEGRSPLVEGRPPRRVDAGDRALAGTDVFLLGLRLFDEVPEVQVDVALLVG